jgi:Skp family chaperone for outer membrane proteins
MHIITRWILVCVAVCTAIPTIAGDVGFLDAERAVSSVKEGQRQLQALEAWGSPKRQQVEALRSRVADLTQQVAAQRAIASADVIKELENDLLKARRDFEDAGRAFNRDMESKQNEFLSQVATQIGDQAVRRAVSDQLMSPWPLYSAGNEMVCVYSHLSVLGFPWRGRRLENCRTFSPGGDRGRV